MKNKTDIYALLDRGSAKRRTAETLLNKQSSRSHSVFCITVSLSAAAAAVQKMPSCSMRCASRRLQYLGSICMNPQLLCNACMATEGIHTNLRESDSTSRCLSLPNTRK